MANVVVVGAQWGDEGKGKIIDVLTANADWVVRYQGGNNAGHTIVVGSERFALSLIPSGVLYPSVTPVIGNGCVVDPAVLVAELSGDFTITTLATFGFVHPVLFAILLIAVLGTGLTSIIIAIVVILAAAGLTKSGRLAGTAAEA